MSFLPTSIAHIWWLLELGTLSGFIIGTYFYASEIRLSAYLTEPAALIITQTYYLAVFAVYAWWICISGIWPFFNLSVQTYFL